MTRFRWTHKPQYGDKFNDKDRGPYRANGLIKNILWSEQTVVVMFWTKGDEVEYSEYTFEEIEGYWTDSFGGTWVMPEHVPPGTEVKSDWLRIFLTKIWLEKRGGYLDPPTV